MQISKFDRLALERDGWAVLPGAVSAATVARMVTVAERLPGAHAHRNLLEVEEVRRFAVSEEAMGVVGAVLGEGARAVRGILFDKVPGANWKVAWHQDLSIAVRERREVEGYGPWSVKEGVVHVQPPVRVLEGMITLRLHLDDCFEENGPVRVLPGTHRFGVLSGERIAALRQEVPEVAAVMGAGGVLLMRPLLLHASSAARVPAHRRVVHIEYAAGVLGGGLAWRVGA